MASDAATNTIALRFTQYSTAIGLTASTEQSHLRMQSYGPVAELWRQAGRIRTPTCHQHTNMDTNYIIQLTAAGLPCRDETGLGIGPSPVGPRTSPQQGVSRSSRNGRAACDRQGMKQTRRTLSLRSSMMSVGDVWASRGRLYQKSPTSPATYKDSQITAVDRPYP